MRWIMLYVGLVLGDLFYEVCVNKEGPDWENAMEWDIAQAVAIVAVILGHPWN